MRAVGLNRSPSRPTSASYSSSSGMISSRTMARTAAMSGRTLSVTPRSMFLSQKLFPRDMAPKFGGRQAEEICAGAFASKDAGRPVGSVSAGLFGGGANFGRESRYSNGLRRHFPAPRPGARRARRGEDRRAPAAGLSAGRHFRARIAGFQRLAAPFPGVATGLLLLTGTGRGGETEVLARRKPRLLAEARLALIRPPDQVRGSRHLLPPVR